MIPKKSTFIARSRYYASIARRKDRWPLRAHGNAEFNGRTARGTCDDFYGCGNQVFWKKACGDGTAGLAGRGFVGWGVVSGNELKVLYTPDERYDDK